MKKSYKALIFLLCFMLSVPFSYCNASETELVTPERHIILGTDHIAGAQKSKIYYGKYPQSDNHLEQPPGTEGIDWVKVGENPLNWCGPYFNIDPIVWRVLKREDKVLLLLSDQNLDGKPYHTDNENVTWEKSTIRSWLNGYGKNENTGGDSGIDFSSDNFKNMAFSGFEWSMIYNTELVNSNNPWYGTYGGNNTVDKVFLLSSSAIENSAFGFTDDDSRYASNPPYWGHRAGSSTTWRLRSPGCYQCYSATVGYSGWIDNYGAYGYYNHIGIRPAIIIDLYAVIFTSGKGAYALTYLDGGREFNITDKSDKTVIEGDSLSFDYTGASYNENGAGNEFISALVVDIPTNTVLRYIQLKKPDSENGTVTFTAPEDLSPDQYFLMFINEQYNGEKRNSFSSHHKSNCIRLSVVPRRFGILPVEDDNTSISVDISDDGRYSVIFADYEDNKLKNIEVITKDFEKGREKITSKEGISLEKGDKVMLWHNTTPKCSALTIE